MASRGKRPCLRLAGLGLLAPLFLFQAADAFIAAPRPARLGGLAPAPHAQHATTPRPHAMPSSSFVQRRGRGAAGPLWIKGQPSLEEDKVSE